MGSHSNVTILGNLTRDPEVKHMDGGQVLTKLSVAINRRWKDRNDQKQEEVTYVDCEAWGRTGETIAQWVGRGDPIYIVGRLKLDRWKDAEGKGRSKLFVVIEHFQFVGEKGAKAGGLEQEISGPIAKAAESGGGDPHLPIGEDDIPF